MDTIRHESVLRAAQALGFNPARVDRIEVNPETITSTRTRPTDYPLAAVACQHLGFPPEDVLDFTLTYKEVTVTLIERDEHGNKILRFEDGEPVGYRTRTEVCNVG